MAKMYIVTLSKEERSQLQNMISTGKSAARKLSHARILLLADTTEAGRTDQEIVDAIGVSVRTVERVRERFVEAGFEAVLNPKSRPRIVSKLEKAEADLVELAKSDPPPGRKRWTLRLLADQAVQWQYLNGLSHESVRQILNKRDKTLVGEVLVHSAQSRCRIRLSHGRRVGIVPLAVRSAVSGGLHGRSKQAVDWRGSHSPSGGRRPTGSL